MAVSIDEVSAEIVPPSEGEERGGRGNQPKSSPECLARRLRELLEIQAWRDERVRAD